MILEVYFPRAFQKRVLKWKLTYIFLFTLLCGALKGFMKAFKPSQNLWDTMKKCKYKMWIFSLRPESRREGLTTCILWNSPLLYSILWICSTCRSSIYMLFRSLWSYPIFQGVSSTHTIFKYSTCINN